MIFELFALAAIGYGVLYHTGKLGQSRVQEFKNPYYPVEADIGDHIARNTPFGYQKGLVLGKQEYANPKPLIVLNEFNDKLNETEWGYAAPIGSPAINTENYRRLIDEIFNVEEHPRLDPTRQEFCKGRHRRAQHAFIGFGV